MRELGEDHVDQVIAYIRKCVVVPLDTTIALLAADVLTCDAHFKGLSGVALFAKSG